MSVASRMNGPWVPGVLVLAVAALAMGALAITPAGSAVDRLSKKEKKQGDTRWINVGEKATTAGTADTATNATNLGGVPASQYLKTTGKAADADKLDGLDSKELSPVGGDGRTADLVLTQLGETVLSATVTTPGSAALLASASVSVLADGGGDDQATCFLRFDGTTSSAFYRTTIPDTAIADTASLPVVWAQPVGAGAHTVELRCHRNTTGNVTVDEAGLMVSAHL